VLIELTGLGNSGRNGIGRVVEETLTAKALDRVRALWARAWMGRAATIVAAPCHHPAADLGSELSRARIPMENFLQSMVRLLHESRHESSLVGGVQPHVVYGSAGDSRRTKPPEPFGAKLHLGRGG
jgi:hypothetical protein